MTRPGCPLPTRACGGELELPIDRWTNPRSGAYGSSVEELEQAADEVYWAGYLAALEEVDALDAGAAGTPGQG